MWTLNEIESLLLIDGECRIEKQFIICHYNELLRMRSASNEPPRNHICFFLVYIFINQNILLTDRNSKLLRNISILTLYEHRILTLDKNEQIMYINTFSLFAISLFSMRKPFRSFPCIHV